VRLVSVGVHARGTDRTLHRANEWQPAYRRRIALLRRIAVAGTIASNVPAARDGLLGYIVGEVEAAVGEIYTTTAAAEIAKLGLQIITGDIDYALAVKLLGCTPSALQGTGSNSSTIAAGRWGVVDDDGGHWMRDVPHAMGVLAPILAVVWGNAAGGPVGKPGFGLASWARIVTNVLPSSKAKEVFVDLFAQAAAQAVRLRTKLGESKVDWPQYVDSIGPRKYHALLIELNAEHAAARMVAAAASKKQPKEKGGGGGGGGEGGGGGTGAEPGGKRNKDGTPKGTPGPVGLPGEREPKRLARQAAYQARVDDPNDPAGKGSPAAAKGKQGGRADWTPDFAKGSITKFVDKHEQRGAVDAFEYLCKQANPACSMLDMPCAFAALAKCNAQADKPCRSCTRQAQMTTPTPVPAGAIAKVKGACDDHVAARITN
jgi:hypothetical protein